MGKAYFLYNLYMSDKVSFDVDKSFDPRMAMAQKKDPALVAFLVKKNIAANADSASRILVAIIVICIVISLAIVGYYYLGIGNHVQVRYNIPPEIQGQMILNAQHQ